MTSETLHPRFKCRVKEYDSISSFLMGDASITKINHRDGKSLNLYHRCAGHETLTIFFSHRIKRDKSKAPPFLTGLNVANDIATDILCVDDIALQYAPETGLGWHAGTHDFKTQNILPDVLNLFIAKQGYKRVIFTGGSGGGFAALFYASLFPNSTAFVVNPQTNFLRYHKQHVLPYLKACFPELKTEDVFNTQCVPGVISSLLNVKNIKSVRAAYLQNIDDEHHVNNHTFPLMNALGAHAKIKSQIVGDFRFMFKNWGKGHAGLPREIYASCLRRIITEDTTIIGDCF